MLKNPTIVGILTKYEQDKFRAQPGLNGQLSIDKLK